MKNPGLGCSLLNAVWEILLAKSKLSRYLWPSFGYHTRKGCGYTQTHHWTKAQHTNCLLLFYQRETLPLHSPCWENSHNLAISQPEPTCQPQSAITSTEVTMAKLVTSWEINCTVWISWGTYRTGRWGTAQQISLLHLQKNCITSMLVSHIVFS